MPDYFETERLHNADFVNNSANRVPVCLCIDASYSMQQDRRILHVNNGIRSFIANSRNNIYACDAIDLCLITFGGEKAQVIQPFANVKDIRFEDIRPGGGTPLAQAVKFAIAQIEKRKEEYSEGGITSYRPWLVIMSDGGSDDDLTEVARTLRRMQEQRQIKVKCIGLGNSEELADLHKLSLNGDVAPMDALSIENFFSMLSKSAAGLSTQIPGEDETDLII